MKRAIHFLISEFGCPHSGIKYPVTTAPTNAGARRDDSAGPGQTLLYALLTGVAVFAALSLFAVYILNQKPKFAPNLQLRDRAGALQPLQASLGKGKPVLLHFWATWCAPCRDELPALIQAVNDGGSGLIFVPVAVDQGGAAAVEKFLAGEKLSLDSLYDPDAVEAQKIGTQSFPETWLLSADGRILAHWTGPEDWNGRMLADKAKKAAVL